MKKFFTYLLIIVSIFFISCETTKNSKVEKQPVDYVNPYMGNISHVLVPTFPTVQLPNSLLRVKPERMQFTVSLLNGLPVMVYTHRFPSVFRISCYQGESTSLKPIIPNYYDQEVVKPYYYSVYLDRDNIDVQYAPSHQSAIYQIDFEGNDKEKYLVFHSANGNLKFDNKTISGFEDIGHQTKVYWYLTLNVTPEKVGSFKEKLAEFSDAKSLESKNIILSFGNQETGITAKYGISFISEEQAQRNLQREVAEKNLKQVAQEGRDIWNATLGKIKIKGATEDKKTVFYTSLYRTCERMINISEDGKYWSGFDKKVHDDGGSPFYTDDWIWDTYLATHPLRTIVEPTMQKNILNSYIRMSQQSKEGWMPTFPMVTHDFHAMNGNHAVSLFLEASNKGISFDMETAYQSCKKSIMEETHIPWRRLPAGEFDEFYRKHGYFPGLHEGEEETIYGVDTNWEQRQCVAVTQSASFDEYCLAMLAQKLGYQSDYDYFIKQSYNYRNIFNKETGFFHPKDAKGDFIMPFDYKYSRGIGGRHYYGENNAYTYQWGVLHYISDLIDLMGGNEKFCTNLDQLFNEDLGKSKFNFISLMPDQSGNVGQFSMGNEPSFHIPYLYNYAGRPWETQKRVHSLLEQWFRNDLMGIPGDEDGGGMSAFVVFSQMGFYPVNPTDAMYTIGTPSFEKVEINLENGNTFKVEAPNVSDENKYIQSATLNGEKLDTLWISHKTIMDGGILVFEMGPRANKQFGMNNN